MGQRLMAMRVLITGGAGFIGSYVADELIKRGYLVRALDSLEPQVHGPDRKRPGYLNPNVELVVGDVRDADAVRRALRGCDWVCHLAAAVGVGQSMYEVSNYTSTNNLGTAVLLQELLQNPVERLLVASSMSVYGEGLYRDRNGTHYDRVTRSPSALEQARWDPTDDDGVPLIAVPTPETKPTNLESVYALSKYDQERLCLLIGKAYKIPTTALRFFNVYGPRQALSNPYTGVLAIFASRLLNGNAPLVFEDGEQRRDFVHVRDVAAACVASLESKNAVGEVLNIGSGTSVSIREVAQRMNTVLGRSRPPLLTGKYRVGDIRHCFADIGRARQVLDYAPRVEFETGLLELAEWLTGQVAVDRVDEMQKELAARGLSL